MTSRAAKAKAKKTKIAAAAAAATLAVRMGPHVIQSPEDKRLYRCIHLISRSAATPRRTLSDPCCGSLTNSDNIIK
jgi:hypothetical protein